MQEASQNIVFPAQARGLGPEGVALIPFLAWALKTSSISRPSRIARGRI
jgi:hypothetical protein